MPIMIQIQAVESRSDLSRFIDVPWRLHSGDPNWVPPLRLAVKDLLDVEKNPFFRHAAFRAFVALKDGEPVGRIAAIVDDAYNAHYKDETGFFGFFESVDDSEAASRLFRAASEWLGARGMKKVMGPANPSLFGECALLVEGFDGPPYVMMSYNPSYYVRLIEGLGLAKAKDMYAWVLDPARPAQARGLSERLIAHAERLKKKTGVSFRSVSFRNWDKEMETLFPILNAAWAENWGYVPMAREEFEYHAKDMKLILDPDMLLLAEVKGEVVGFGIALPDVNQVFKRIPDGKLLPSGLLKILWYLKGPGRRRAIDQCRIAILGIRPGIRARGLGPLLYVEYYKRLQAMGYRRGEASWVLEDNVPMNRALEEMGAERSRTYRIYEKVLQ